MIEGERSHEAIEMEDLATLSRIAAEDREEFFSRCPRWAVYAQRRICVALCQGAALHYVDRKTGVKDFDVWTFYAEHPVGPYPPRRHVVRDFGLSKFGRHPSDTHLYGRGVDLFARSLKVHIGAGPVTTLRNYLSRRATRPAQLLSEKAVVIVDPPELRGQVVWPDSGSRYHARNN